MLSTLLNRGPALHMATAGALHIQDLHKSFGAVHALRGIDLHIEEGEVFGITGPSGAGKSTLARLISGLENADSGKIHVGRHHLSDLPAQARRVAHMFESYALYPTLTVAQNIASPLRAPSHAGQWSEAQQQARIHEVLELTEIAHLRERLPSQLSGGQKQRVALCRALVQDPSVFLLDEPIGHLDAKLRHHLRGEIRRRQNQLRQPTVWFTPDGIEAMAVSNRLAVLIEGQVQQIGTPDDIYLRPANTRVARLMGDPATNVLEVQVTAGTLSSLRLPGCPDQAISGALAMRLLTHAVQGRLQLGLRPTQLHLRTPEDRVHAGEDSMLAQVYAVEPLGKHSIVTLSVGHQRLRAKVPGHALWKPQQRVRVVFRAEQLLVFEPDHGALLSAGVSTPADAAQAS